MPKEKKYTEKDLITLARTHGWKGSGSEDDPIVVEPSEIFPNHFKIKESSLYIIFSRFTISYITFDNCQNITIEKGSFDNITFTKCHDMKLVKCLITFVLFVHSHYCVVDDCYIKRIQNVNSRAFTFQNNKLPAKFLKKPHKRFSTFFYFLIVMVPIIVYLNIVLIFLTPPIYLAVVWFVLPILDITYILLTVSKCSSGKI